MSCIQLVCRVQGPDIHERNPNQMHYRVLDKFNVGLDARQKNMLECVTNLCHASKLFVGLDSLTNSSQVHDHASDKWSVWSKA